MHQTAKLDYVNHAVVSYTQSLQFPFNKSYLPVKRNIPYLVVSAANTGSVPAAGIVVRKRSVTGWGMTVIAVAAGTVTAERTAASVAGQIACRCRQQMDVSEPVPAGTVVTGSADKV